MPVRRLGKVAVIAVLALAAAGIPAGRASVTVTLLWTAPGDDATTGLVAGYDVRWSTAPITDQNFHLASRMARPPAPRVAGSGQVAVITGLAEGRSYYFAVKSYDEAGNVSAISNVSVFTAALVDVAGGPGPLVFSAPFPNPARHENRFAIRLPEPGPVRVEVFDFGGRRVRTLFDGPSSGLRSELRWDLRDASGAPVPAGVYLVRGRLAGQTLTRRALVVR